MSSSGKVQKKKKNSKITPFWLFSMELMKKMNQKGHNIANDQQLREMAGPHWNKLSEQEKEKYKKTAKDSPSMPNSTRILYNSAGQSLAEVEALKIKKEEDALNLTKDIEKLLDQANDLGELDTLVFYFVSTTSFYVSTNDIFPAELAMAKFSLKEGIIDELQIRINPGKLPLGAKLEAQEKSKQKHKYSLPPDCKGESNYMRILESMIKFLHPMDELPILFTDDKTPETCDTVRKIFYESQEDDMLSMLKIYPVTELLYRLRNKAVKSRNLLNDTKLAAFPSLPYACDKFNNPEYTYLTMGCDYHDGNGVQEHCALSKVRYSGYILSKWCSDNVKYELYEGKHYPRGLQVDDKRDEM